MKVNRRTVLSLGAFVGVSAVIGKYGNALLPAPQYDFTPVDRPAGFRRIARGDGLSVGNMFFGLDGEVPPIPDLTDAEICRLLFGTQTSEPGQVAIALFSDFFCPYCRVLDVKVRDLAARDARVTVVPHEVPLLGVPSQFAARAVIAAQVQGAYDAFHARLIRTTFVPNPAYLRSIAETEGLDVDQFTADMRSPQTDQQLKNSAALFRTFGFAGTPALAVGRTLVNGAISERDLRGLTKLELSEDIPAGCR